MNVVSLHNLSVALMELQSGRIVTYACAFGRVELVEDVVKRALRLFKQRPTYIDEWACYRCAKAQK